MKECHSPGRLPLAGVSSVAVTAMWPGPSTVSACTAGGPACALLGPGLQSRVGLENQRLPESIRSRFCKTLSKGAFLSQRHGLREPQRGWFKQQKCAAWDPEAEVPSPGVARAGSLPGREEPAFQSPSSARRHRLLPVAPSVHLCLCTHTSPFHRDTSGIGFGTRPTSVRPLLN